MCLHMSRRLGMPCFSLVIEMYGYSPKSTFAYHTHEAAKGENQRETPESTLRVSVFSIPEMHSCLQAFFNSIKYVGVHSRNFHLA